MSFPWIFLRFLINKIKFIFPKYTSSICTSTTVVYLSFRISFIHSQNITSNYVRKSFCYNCHTNSITVVVVYPMCIQFNGLIYFWFISIHQKLNRRRNFKANRVVAKATKEDSFLRK